MAQQNSWCKVLAGTMVEGPRAWDNNTPPDDSWWPHVIVDPAHTINDRFMGSSFSPDVSVKKVFEVNHYEPKPAEQVAAEVAQLNATAAENVAFADSVLADPALPNAAEWTAYRAAWAALVSVTELSWDYNTPSRPSA